MSQAGGPCDDTVTGADGAARMRRRQAIAGALGLWLTQAAGAPGQLAKVVSWPRLRLLDGTEIEPAQWQGRSVLVVFWATWCSYCKRHNERLSRLYAARDETSPRVLALSVDGDAASVARHVRAQGWTFPVALDEGRLRPQLTDRLSVPLTVLIGPEGQVRERIPGEMTEDDLRQLLRPRAG